MSTPHEGPLGLRAAAAEARSAIIAARAGGKPPGVTAHDATGVQRMLMEWYEQGSIGRTAQRLHLHRNAVSYRMRRITSLLGVDIADPDQRLALQLACRARLLQ